MDSSTIKDSGGFSDSNSSFITVTSNKASNDIEEVVVHSPTHSDANSSITSDYSSVSKVNSNTKAVQNSVTKEILDDSKDSLPATLSNDANAQYALSMSNNLRSSTPVPSDNEFQQQDKATEFNNQQKQISSPTSANCRMPNTQLLDADNENKEELKNSNVPAPKFELDCGMYLLRVISNEGQKNYFYHAVPDRKTFEIETIMKKYGSGSSKTNKKKQERRFFTEEQKRRLEVFYAQGKYITNIAAEKIGAFLNVSYNRVQRWFQYRRRTDRQKIRI